MSFNKRISKFLSAMTLGFCSIVNFDSFTYGMEYDKTGNKFKCNNFFDLYSSSTRIGGGSSAYVYKTKFKNDEEVAVKVFNFGNDEPFKNEKNIVEKICKYINTNKLNENLMKVLEITEVIDKTGSKRNAIVLEYIEGTTLSKWWKNGNKFLDVDSLIDSFYIPVISAFMDYQRITGQPLPDVRPMNIIIKSNNNSSKIEPVLIDYGPGDQSSSYSKLRETFRECCKYVENESEKLTKLSKLFDQEISSIEDIKQKILEIGNIK